MAQSTFAPLGNSPACRDTVTGRCEHRVFDVGRHVPPEARQAFARAVIGVDRL